MSFWTCTASCATSGTVLCCILKPEEYTLASILHATEGSLAAVACLEDHAPECARAGQCPTRPIWEKLNNLIEDYLGSITLADFHKTIIPCKIEK